MPTSLRGKYEPGPDVMKKGAKKDRVVAQFPIALRAKSAASHSKKRTREQRRQKASAEAFAEGFEAAWRGNSFGQAWWRGSCRTKAGGATPSAQSGVAVGVGLWLETCPSATSGVAVGVGAVVGSLYMIFAGASSLRPKLVARPSRRFREGRPASSPTPGARVRLPPSVASGRNSVEETGLAPPTTLSKEPRDSKDKRGRKPLAKLRGRVYRIPI